MALRTVCVCVCERVKLETVGCAYKPSYKRSEGQQYQQTDRLAACLPAARVVNNYETMAQTLWMHCAYAHVCVCVCECTVSVCTACGSHMFALCVLWHVLAELLAWMLPLLRLPPAPCPLPSTACLHCTTCCILPRHAPYDPLPCINFIFWYGCSAVSVSMGASNINFNCCENICLMRNF